MSEPRTIVVHNGSRIFGGAERWAVRLLQGMAERGHRTVVLCADGQIRGEFEQRGIRARVAHVGGQLMIPEAVRLAWVLRQYRPDAVLLSTFKKIWLAGMAARMAGVPRVVARIGLSTDLPRRSWTYRVSLRRWIDHVVLNSDAFREPFLGDLPGYDTTRVSTIYNGVRLRGGSRNGHAPGQGPDRTQRELRAALGLPTKGFLVGTAARLVRQKRHDRLVEALPHLPGVHAAFIGEGRLRADLELRAAKLGVGDRVHFVGHREDVPDIISVLDLYVVASDREGMSNSMLEAMAVGVPVVSTRVSGAEEALVAMSAGEDTPGRVVDTSTEALGDGIRSVLGDSELRGRMAEAARNVARDRFDIEKSHDFWEETLLGTHG